MGGIPTRSMGTITSAPRFCGSRLADDGGFEASGLFGVIAPGAWANEGSMIGAVARGAGKALTLNRKSAVLCRSLAACASTGPMLRWAWRNQWRETF